MYKLLQRDEGYKLYGDCYCLNQGSEQIADSQKSNLNQTLETLGIIKMTDIPES